VTRGSSSRTTAGDRAYQVNVDHLADAGVGTIYGEVREELRYRPYYLTDMGATPVRIPSSRRIFDLAKWPTIWKPTEFNEIARASRGNPPHMQVWISGLQVMDYTDVMKRTENRRERAARIQVHGGPDRWKANGSVQFRNIRVRI